MYRDGSLQRLKQALRAHREALEELESALLQFEESLDTEAKRVRKRGKAWICFLYLSPAKSRGWARVGSTGDCAAERSRA
jgi:hypothetical protein